MSRKFKLLIVTVVGVCALMALWSEQKRLSIVQAQNEPSKLTLEISAGQNEYLKLEPILFKLKLSNQTNNSLKWGGQLKIGQNTNLLIRNENGESTRWELSKYYFHDGVSPSSKPMLPGNSKESQSLLSGQLVEMIFPRRGRYEVQIEYVYNNYSPQREQIKLTSNPINIIIREPEGINLQAYNYIKNTLEPTKEQATRREFAQVRQNFIDTFRNSVYAKYIAVELAQIYETLGEDEKAEKELCKIRGINFYYSEQVRDRLQKIAAKLRPMPLIPNLPENAQLPPRPQPCVGQPTP